MNVAITGGARGIGHATATVLAARGARVAIGDLDGEQAEAAAGDAGPGVAGFSLDVTDGEGFAGFLDAAEERLGPLDALVNNAGIMPVRRFAEEDEATTRRALDVNVHGVITGSKLALERMLPRGRGHVVNIASIAGKQGVPGFATYCASKHAVVGLTEALRLEFRGRGIDFTCVLPALIDTELSRGLPESPGVHRLEPAQVAEAIAGALERPRPTVYVPRAAGVGVRVVEVLPRRVQDLLVRFGGGERITDEVAGADVRAEYEARAAASAPASDGRAEAERAKAQIP